MLKITVKKEDGPDKLNDKPDLYETAEYHFTARFSICSDDYTEEYFAYEMKLRVDCLYHITHGWIVQLPAIISGSEINCEGNRPKMVEKFGQEIYETTDKWYKNKFTLEVLKDIEDMIFHPESNTYEVFYDADNAIKGMRMMYLDS